MGRITVVVGCLFAILMAIAIDNIQGLNLFDVFQAVLGFIAPPLSVVFLLAVFWKRTTKRAVNFTLSYGSAISLGIGVLYLWVFPAKDYHFWPHYLLLSFFIFALLSLVAIIISLLDQQPVEVNETTQQQIAPPSKLVSRVWIALAIVMVCLYLFLMDFNITTHA